MKYIDLSHVIENGTITYKGLPAPIICDFLSREDSKGKYAGDTTFQIGKIEMVTNTGTYIDCPFHRYEEGKDTSEMALERFVNIPAVKMSFPFDKSLEINKEHFKDMDLKGKAVLIHTGWDKHWNTDLYFENHPYLTEDAALYLQKEGVVLVGIDSHNIDDTKGNSRPVHTILLASEILIVEHLCQLDLLPSEDFTFTAVPPKFKGVGTFPVRAFASIF